MKLTDKDKQKKNTDKHNRPLDMININLEIYSLKRISTLTVTPRNSQNSLTRFFYYALLLCSTGYDVLVMLIGLH